MRLQVVLLSAALCASACARNIAPTTAPSISTTRANILLRDIAWLGDSTPVLRFNTPYIYGAWRLEIEACSGLARDGWPKFYVAPIGPIINENGFSAALYIADVEAIVFAVGNESRHGVVLHELLHWLLEPNISPAPLAETSEARKVRVHPSEFFERRCGTTLRDAP